MKLLKWLKMMEICSVKSNQIFTSSNQRTESPLVDIQSQRKSLLLFYFKSKKTKIKDLKLVLENQSSDNL